MNHRHIEEMIAETKERHGEQAAMDEEELFAAFAGLTPGDRLQQIFHETFASDRASS